MGVRSRDTGQRSAAAAARGGRQCRRPGKPKGSVALPDIEYFQEQTGASWAAPSKAGALATGRGDWTERQTLFRITHAPLKFQILAGNIPLIEMPTGAMAAAA